MTKNKKTTTKVPPAPVETGQLEEAVTGLVNSLRKNNPEVLKALQQKVSVPMVRETVDSLLSIPEGAFQSCIDHFSGQSDRPIQSQTAIATTKILFQARKDILALADGDLPKNLLEEMGENKAREVLGEKYDDFKQEAEQRASAASSK